MDKQGTTALWRSVESKSLELEKSSSDVDAGKKAPDSTFSEFPKQIREYLNSHLRKDVDRKKFLKVMGASLTMAAASCTPRKIEKIIPYISRPRNTIPGEAVYYASSYHDSLQVSPVLVKTVEGKPRKIEPIDDHPLSKGGLNAHAFATIWDLYDPDRLKSPRGKLDSVFVDISWDSVQKKISSILESSKNIRIISKNSFSPVESDLVNKFVSRHDAKEIIYDSVGNIQEIQDGNQDSYRRSVVPYYRFDKADIVLSVEADFLGTWLDSVMYAKQYATRRKVDSKMQKVISVESNYSLTGANADERFILNPGTHITFILGLAGTLLSRSSYAKNVKIKKLLSPYSSSFVTKETGIASNVLERIANSLWKHRRRSLVVSGGIGTRNAHSGSVQVATNFLNTILENEGFTINYNVPYYGEFQKISSFQEQNDFLEELKERKIDTLIINKNANPFFDLSSSIDWDKVLKSVKNIIYIGSHLNETAEYAHFVLATDHAYESWSDSYTQGVYAVTQPVMEPLYETKSLGNIWMLLTDLVKSSGDTQKWFLSYLKSFKKSYASRIKWENLLKNGFYRSKLPKYLALRFSTSSLVLTSKLGLSNPKGVLLGFYSSTSIMDGSGGNISFRQELPDPITKTTWGNYALISPFDAKAYHLESGDIVEIEHNSHSFEIPAFIQPGLAKGLISVAIGHGHSSSTQVAKDVGVNVACFSEFSKTGINSSAISVKLIKTQKRTDVATTQLHNAIDDTVDHKGTQKRVARLVQNTTLSNYSSWVDIKKRKEEKIAKTHGKGLYPKKEYNSDYKWGMSIDLNACIGCSACVVSCYSENNIPAVGREEVIAGSEMSWIRIDRYYVGSEDEPQTLFQPILCQHCENAPCETVCPVVATTHTEDGLNHMAYNRCIGTRYCANNCPFKVRRFNWFENWEGKVQDPMQYALNSDVIVRSRGVIEKCSFCIQRIAEKRQKAKSEDRIIRDGEVKTACQQGCPTNAIQFGNVKDEVSIVSKHKKDERSYRILDELNVKSSIHYMAKVRNDLWS